jgi:hypothetical protein
MTTKVQILNKGPRPIKVTVGVLQHDFNKSEILLEETQSEEFYVHSHQSLKIDEVKE